MSCGKYTTEKLGGDGKIAQKGCGGCFGIIFMGMVVLGSIVVHSINIGVWTALMSVLLER